MNKEIEIPDGYEARIEGNKVIIKQKESEDDRIRKHIIEVFKERVGYVWKDGTTNDECLAYLEKQKEQKSRRFKVGDIVTNGDDVYTIDHIGSDCYWLKEHDCATIPFEYEDKWCIVEQKPAECSEEDEHCIELLDTIIDSSALIPKNKTKCHNFIKSLRSKPRWKPSEEQLLALKMHSPVHVPDIHLASLYDDLLKLL